MAQVGIINHLEVIKELPFGYYLEGENLGSILLPNKVAPKGCKIGDWLDVFLYHDSEDRIIATTRTPLALVEQCAYLRTIAITKVGAFVDWGLDKDLLVPFNEQLQPMAEGLSYVVYLFVDEETGRIAGSTRLRDFLSEKGTEFTPGQEVELLISARTDLGYKAVINGTHLGLLFRDEAFKPLRIGSRAKGFIKQIREDEKIDLCLQLHNPEARGSLAEQIIEDLIAHGGLSTLTDKSPAEEISKRFNVSKAAYKKALGALYKQKRIALDKTKIILINDQ
jgi:predicted RNA-binding protein (virulence factor B family)